MAQKGGDRMMIQLLHDRSVFPLMLLIAGCSGGGVDSGQEEEDTASTRSALALPAELTPNFFENQQELSTAVLPAGESAACSSGGTEPEVFMTYQSSRVMHG